VDSAQPVLDLVTSAEAKTHDLAARLESCRAAGQDIAYPDAAMAVAELFCRFSRYDATQSGVLLGVVFGQQCVHGVHFSGRARKGHVGFQDRMTNADTFAQKTESGATDLVLAPAKTRALTA
jgi:hypothetical protein